MWIGIMYLVNIDSIVLVAASVIVFVIDILIEVSIVQGTGCFISKYNKYI